MDTLARMRAFVDVVREGGYSAASRATGRSKAILSKDVRDLEDWLGTRLLNRTTRSLALTDAGERYLAEAKEILGRVDQLDASFRESGEEPRGPLRVSAPRAYSEGLIGEAIVDFAATYKEVTMEVVFEDRFIDMVAERFDVAVRISELSDSSLIARKLAPFRTVVCATPELIETYGEPKVPEDIGRVPAIVDGNHRHRGVYGFDTPEGRRSVRVQDRMMLNSPHGVHLAARAGLGFAQLPIMSVQDDIASGRLKVVLQPYEIKGLGIYAVYPERRHLAAKVRAFVDHMVAAFLDADCQEDRHKSAHVAA